MRENQHNNRTAHLLALMKKGDDAFNARDFAAVDAIHHPDMVAFITGNAQPIYGRVAHAAAMQQMLRIFPDVHVHNDQRAKRLAMQKGRQGGCHPQVESDSRRQ